MGFGIRYSPEYVKQLESDVRHLSASLLDAETRAQKAEKLLHKCAVQMSLCSGSCGNADDDVRELIRIAGEEFEAEIKAKES